MADGLLVEDLGLVPYAKALEIQTERVAQRRSGEGQDTLFLLEHPPVITLGRSAKRDHLLASDQLLAARGIDVFEIARGGDVTFHGPGQLVGYLIVNLAERDARDVHVFLRCMEEALVEVLAGFEIEGGRIPGYTGVFVEESRGSEHDGAGEAEDPAASSARRLRSARKIASIGVGIRGWVTFHGFGLNVDTDLSYFSHIVPCGLDEVEMTSIARELGTQTQHQLAERVRALIAEAFRKRFP